MNMNRCQAAARVTVPVTMPATWLLELNRIAAARGISRSRLVREALAALGEMPGQELDEQPREGVR